MYIKPSYLSLYKSSYPKSIPIYEPVEQILVIKNIQGDGTPFYHQLTNRGEGLRSQEQKEQGKVRERAEDSTGVLSYIYPICLILYIFC